MTRTHRIGPSLAGLFALVVILMLPSMAQALEGQVQVRGAGLSTTQVKVNLSDLGSPETFSYSINGTTQDLSGFTLQQILDEAESQSASLEVSSATSVNIPRPSNGTVSIEQADFSDGPPLFYEEDGTVKFVDPTGPRILTFTQAIPAIELVVSEQAVSIAANPASGAKAGEQVTFVAQPEGQSNGETVSYTWKFGDGTSASGANPKHTFRKKGQFSVKVTAKGSAGFTASAAVTYSVDQKDQEKEKKEKKESESKDPDPPPASNSTDSYGGYDGYSGYGSYGGGSTSPYADGTSIPASPSTPVQPAAPDPEEQVDPPVDDGLIEVTGELVSSSAPAATVPPGTLAPEAAPEETPAAQKQGIHDGVWVFLGLMTLFALGGLAEKRGSRLR